MASKKDLKLLRDELLGMLASEFAGIDVELEHSKRWGRNCVTFRWTGFEGLLPEERFHRLVSIIPEDFRLNKLAGFVWLELAPGETVDDHLKSPRSEDLQDRRDEISSGLHSAGFFESLREALGSAPKKNCPGDFSTLVHVLRAKQFTPSQIRDAKLAFIGEGVYCDCQTLLAELRNPP